MARDNLGALKKGDLVPAAILRIFRAFTQGRDEERDEG